MDLKVSELEAVIAEMKQEIADLNTRKSDKILVYSSIAIGLVAIVISIVMSLVH